MTPIDEAVGILRGLASQVKNVEPHCVELRTDPEEGTYLSLEFLCGNLALWVQAMVDEEGQVDEGGRAWVSVQLEPIALPKPLGMARLVHLSRRLRALWPSLQADISVRNRGTEECVVEAEWYGEIVPRGEAMLFPAVAALLHEMQTAALALEEALQEAEEMQEVEERVAGLLLGTTHTSPRKPPRTSSRRRRGHRR